MSFLDSLTKGFRRNFFFLSDDETRCLDAGVKRTSVGPSGSLGEPFPSFFPHSLTSPFSLPSITPSHSARITSPSTALLVNIVTF